jgi:hypothetical protein
MAFKLLLAVIACVAVANGAISRDAFGQFRFRCSTAMKCTELARCDFNGMISSSPLRLTPEEEEARVPLLPCRSAGGQEGYCCRDPDFKDDWPADYKDPTVRPPRPTKRPDEEIRPTTTPPRVKPKPTQAAVNTGCPERNRTALPDLNPGAWVPGDFDSGHGEFLWQAAVLDSSRNLLCGCYLTSQYTCTTTASCVKSYISNPAKIQVAIGVYDLKNFNTQEPGGGYKEAQFAEVQEVVLDPNGRDIAMVALNVKKDPIQYNYYTAPICIDLPEGLKTADYDNCVITGWGSSRSTPHWFDVKLLSESECSSLVKGFNPSFQSCARADRDICDLIEFGGGLQCRYRGTRSTKDVRDVYWLRGVHHARSCSPGNQIIVYSHLDMDWLDKQLKIREDYLKSLDL